MERSAPRRSSIKTTKLEGFIFEWWWSTVKKKRRYNRWILGSNWSKISPTPPSNKPATPKTPKIYTRGSIAPTIYKPSKHFTTPCKYNSSCRGRSMIIPSSRPLAQSSKTLCLRLCIGWAKSSPSTRSTSKPASHIQRRKLSKITTENNHKITFHKLNQINNKIIITINHHPAKKKQIMTHEWTHHPKITTTTKN